jgi:hypothetical protein
MTHAEMFVRFTDGKGYTLHSVENTPANRRTLDRMAWWLLAKPNVVSVDVDVVVGRTAGYARSR